MTRKRKQLTAVLLAALAILAVASGGVLAATSFDTSTTDATTTSQSDVSGTSTTVNLRPGNSSQALYVEINSTEQDNVTLKLKPEDSDGDVVNYTAYENDTATNETLAGWDSSRTHWSFNVTHDELEDLPRDVDGADYRLELYGSNGSELTNTTVNFDHVADNSTSKTAVVHVANTTDATTHEVADELEISETFAFWGAQEFWTDNGTDVATWSAYTTVNKSNESVELHMIDDDSVDAYDGVAEDYEDGEWMRESTVWINGIPVKVYLNEAPDEEPDNYAIYDEDAEELEAVRSDDPFEDVRTVQLRGGAGEGYGFGTLWSEFGVTDAISSLMPKSPL